MLNGMISSTTAVVSSRVAAKPDKGLLHALNIRKEFFGARIADVFRQAGCYLDVAGSK